MIFSKEVNEAFNKCPSDLNWIKDNTLFLTVHGSIAYGLNTPESDVDLRGICIPTKKYFLGFAHSFNEWVVNDPDCTIFNLKKFVNLASQGNPNCLELLFVDEKYHIIVSDLGKMLLDNKDLFLSKNLKERYIGYSKSQAYRIRNHRKWLLNPRSTPPTRKECGLPEKPEIDKDQFDAIKNLISKKVESWNIDFEPFSESQKIYLQNKVSSVLAEIKIADDDKWLSAARTIGLDNNLIDILKKEKEYENRLRDWKSYLEWKKNRNPIRAEMEAKFGYDLKHATQLIRLLRLGKEILETGKVQVERIHDREELLAIKKGAWSYDKLIEYADQVENEIKEIYNKSKLPKMPNINKLDELCIKMIEQSFLKE